MVASSLRTDSGIVLSFLFAGAVGSVLLGADAFAPSSSRASGLATHAPRSLATRQQAPQLVPSSFGGTRNGYCASGNPLFAAKSGGGKKKRRRRKRKKEEGTSAPVAAAATTTTTTTTPVASPPPAVETPPPAATTLASESSSSVDTIAESPPTFEGEEINVADIQNVASFNFQGDNPLEASAPEAVDEAIVQGGSAGAVQQEDGSIPLPDIKDALRRKKMEATSQTAPGGPMEDNMPKEKIDRTDRAALLKLLEQDPYADGDDSFFYEQEYTSISAWLGEGTKPFLGIPTGPLQVGHFIGALVIVLMAFVEYPGFPLTNLPTPLRGALQGGLGTIYGINALLCVVTFFKANERGQPVALWISKTLAVGGLALDQLSQLPTTAEVEAAKARKGKRALKNRIKTK